MIFSELYSAYYNTVAAVLKAACDHPLRKGELRRIVDQKAFGESVLNIEPSIASSRAGTVPKATDQMNSVHRN